MNFRLIHEAILLSQLPDHANVVKFYGITIHTDVFLVLEFCDDFSLDLAVTKLQPKFGTKMKWAMDTAKVLLFLWF